MHNTAEVIAEVVKYHNPEAVKNQMVYEVWEDGEVTLQKGGDLYCQRNLHQIVDGNPACTLPGDALPIKNGKNHSRIACMTAHDAYMASKAIQGTENPRLALLLVMVEAHQITEGQNRHG